MRKWIVALLAIIIKSITICLAGINHTFHYKKKKKKKYLETLIYLYFYEYGLVPRERGRESTAWRKDAPEERVVCFYHNAVYLSKYIHFSISLHCVSYMTTFNKAGYVAWKNCCSSTRYPQQNSFYYL